MKDGCFYAVEKQVEEFVTAAIMLPKLIAALCRCAVNPTADIERVARVMLRAEGHLVSIAAATKPKRRTFEYANRHDAAYCGLLLHYTTLRVWRRAVQRGEGELRERIRRHALPVFEATGHTHYVNMFWSFLASKETEWSDFDWAFEQWSSSVPHSRRRHNWSKDNAMEHFVRVYKTMCIFRKVGGPLGAAVRRRISGTVSFYVAVEAATSVLMPAHYCSTAHPRCVDVPRMVELAAHVLPHRVFADVVPRGVRDVVGVRASCGDDMGNYVQESAEALHRRYERSNGEVTDLSADDDADEAAAITASRELLQEMEG